MAAYWRALVSLLACLALWPLEAAAWDRGKVEKVCDGCGRLCQSRGPDGSPHGDVYVTTFAVTGRAQRSRDSSSCSTTAAPEAASERRRLEQPAARARVHPDTHELLVIDFGHAQVLRVNFAHRRVVRLHDGDRGAGLNALTFDRRGTCTSQIRFGIIWKTGPNGGAATVWVADPLLLPNGGRRASGEWVEFNSAERALFVAIPLWTKIIRSHLTPACTARLRVLTARTARTASHR